jgi:arylformamidase
MTDLEREYSPSSRVGGTSQPFIDDYVARSADAAAALADRVQILPGGTRLVSAGPGAPLLVFVHGGYWQALSAADSLYLAPRALAQGWSFAAIEYTLAPVAGLEIMVDECRAALASLFTHGPFSEVVLAGHSAGAHLAAMSALVSPAPVPLARVVLVSGVYDLRPLVHTTINDPLGLDDAMAAAMSPAVLPVAARLPVLLTVGDNETEAFVAQQRLYAARLRSAGCTARDEIAPGRHHFDIVDDLVDASSAIGAFTLGGSHS